MAGHFMLEVSMLKVTVLKVSVGSAASIPQGAGVHLWAD